MEDYVHACLVCVLWDLVLLGAITFNSKNCDFSPKQNNVIYDYYSLLVTLPVNKLSWLKNLGLMQISNNSHSTVI